jgi:hypothetical protein
MRCASSPSRALAVAPALRAPAHCQVRAARRAPLAPPRSSAASGGAAVPEPAPPSTEKTGVLAGLKQLATPFSDPLANSRLVALCVAQMLCSVATLIHDT